MIRFLSIALVAIWLVQPAVADQSALVKGVRSWVAPDKTRVVFDLSQSVSHHIFTLDNPDRVVVDIQRGHWQANTDRTLPEQGYIQRLRSASKGERLRLVLDTDRVVKPKSFLLKPNDLYGHRLVIDLYEKGRGLAKAVKSVKHRQDQGFRDVIIAIDAGHGGEDPGAIGPGKTYEKHITLVVAKKLKQEIDKQPGMRAVLTRDGDYYLKLRERIQKAREYRADLFVSLHADAFHSHRVRGSSVYILSERGASSEAAKWLADKENSADELMGGVSLDDKDPLLKEVLLDLSQTATIEASVDLAKNTLKELKTVGRVHKPRVERAGFAVLKSPDIPSILVELAFISNPSEEKKLKNRAYQTSMAKAITRGVKRYFYHRPPNNTVFSKQIKTHQIERGDTLSSIARRYDTTLQQLKGFNMLRSESLEVGQVIRIPSSGS